MNKALEAFYKIKAGYICGQGAINEYALRENERESLDLVEATLKKAEAIDKCHLVAIPRMSNKTSIVDEHALLYLVFKIIATKEVNMLWLYCSFELNCNNEEQCKEYNKQWQYLPEKEKHYLTLDEYDLLKEIFTHVKEN